MNSLNLKLKKNKLMLYSLYSLGFFGMASMGIIFPTVTLYALKLRANEFEIGLIQGLSSAITVFTMVPFGYLSDSYGRKKFLIFAFIVALTSFISYSFVSSIPQLMIVRGFHGLFTSSFYPSAYAMAITLSSLENRGTILGLFSLFISFGFALGNFFSGILIEKFGFKITFYFCGFLAFIGLSIIFTKLNSYSESFRAKGDIKIKSELVRNKKLTFILFIPFIAFYSYGTTYAFFPLYGKSLGLTDSVIGIYLASYSIASSLMSIFSGKIIDKFGSLIGIANGLIIGAIAYLLLFFSNKGFLILVALIIAGISNSLTYLSSQTFLTKEVSMSIMSSAVGI
ncbi:MAG: MFS transporter, partial [Candidatus Bathyarchaeia archaeon]